MYKYNIHCPSGYGKMYMTGVMCLAKDESMLRLVSVTDRLSGRPLAKGHATCCNMKLALCCICKCQNSSGKKNMANLRFVRNYHP